MLTRGRDQTFTVGWVAVAIPGQHSSAQLCTCCTAVGVVAAVGDGDAAAGAVVTCADVIIWRL